MSEYEPELGQLSFGCPWGATEAPEYVTALLEHILCAIEIAFSNREQREWGQFEDPGIDGITFRPYYWGEDAAEAALPNFVLNAQPEQEVRWYKWPGRGMSVTQDWTPERWVAWFDACCECVRVEGQKTWDALTERT